jgi:hypothetical protein
MNEFQARAALIEALGGDGSYGNERDFWTSVLTALNNGAHATANNAPEFWAKFADLLPAWQGGLAANQAIVTSGDELPGTGGTYEPVIEDNVVTGGTWTAD